MTYNPDIHHRRSIRLRDYDYSAAGAYFVTICAQNRECLFGDVVGDEMVLNDAGRMIENVWRELPDHYPGVDVDMHVVMPNHFHGIIILNVGAAPRGRPAPNGRPDYTNPMHGQARGPAPTLTLPDVVHRFKSLTTAKYRMGANQSGWPSFSGKLWQRNYYERIIRNEVEMNGIREYIDLNPLKWTDDEENPKNP